MVIIIMIGRKMAAVTEIAQESKEMATLKNEGHFFLSIYNFLYNFYFKICSLWQDIITIDSLCLQGICSKTPSNA